MLVGFGQKPKILETASNSVDPKYRNYKPSPVRRVEIPKPDGGIRLLGVPTAIDRVIQQAISQILSPIYEEIFADQSYGFRKQRSSKMAITKSKEYID